MLGGRAMATALFPSPLMQLLQIDKEGPRRRALRAHPPLALSRVLVTGHYQVFSRDSTLLRRGHTEPIRARGDAHTV